MSPSSSPNLEPSSRPHRPLFWVAGALLLIVAIAGIWWWRGREPALRYVTVRVTRGDIQRTVTMTGALNPVVTAQVESYVSGNIKAWYCDYNTLVKVGQICAVIDPLPFQVVVDQDTASLHSAMAQLAKDQAAAANQATVYAYDQKLIGQGIVSQETINTDKATLDQEHAQVQLDQALIAQQQAALHGARINLGYTKIKSPVNGMVITRYIDVGQTVVSSLSAAPLFLIGKDMHSMQVDTNVSEADVGGVKPAAQAYFTVQAYPTRTFHGTVRQVREGPITVQNVVTYDVVIDVNNDDLALYPGMTADAHIITAQRRDVLRVPLPALRFNPQGLASLVPRARNAGRPGGAGGAGGPGDASHAGARQGDANQAHRTPFALRAGRDASHGGDERASGTNNATLARAASAQIWVLRQGQLVPVRVRPGLDDGTLIEVSSADLRAGDAVVVNAVRPNAPPTVTPAPDRAGAAGFRGGFRL